jgi:hypothetical protein
MNLNNIELPASVVVELYSSSLISTNEIPVIEKKLAIEKPVTSPPSDNMVQWKSLGNNQKSILVIVNNEEVVHLADKELNFLSGILGACKLTIADVAIVNINNHPGVTYKELTTFFKSRIVFLFNIEPATFGLPMSFPYYQIQSFANNSFLFSPSLKDLEDDKIEKSKLWVCLKRLFNL